MRTELKNARLTAKLTALTVAERAGMSEDRIFALERGRGRLHEDEARALAKVLKIRPAIIAPELFETKGGRR